MRKLMWFTVGFAAASAYGAFVWNTGCMVVPALVLAVLFLLLLLGGRSLKVLRIPAVICLGLAAGLMWFQLFFQGYLSRTSEMDGQLAQVTARCTDYGYETDWGTAADGILYLDGKPYRGKFYVSGNVDMEPGDILEGIFELQVTTLEGTYDSSYYQGEGVFLLAYQQEDARLTKLADVPLWTYPVILRQKLLDLIDGLFPQDTAGFCKALFLGFRLDLDYETKSAFQTAGIMHIVAVSGLHVTILFTLVNIICFKRRWLVALIGIPLLALFAVVGGGSPSVIRACIMQILIILAMLFNREYDGPSELAFACLAMLFCNPLIVLSVSFQLSVGCMIGIFLFQKKIAAWVEAGFTAQKSRFRKRLISWFSTSVSMTLSSMSLTTPLVAYYFGTVSLVGIVTNLLTLWVITFIFYGIILGCLMGWLIPAAGGVLAWMISWPVRYVLLTAKVLARIPFAAVYTASIYITLWLVFSYVLFALFLVMKQKKPRIFAICVAFGLCLCVALSWVEPLTDDCRMTVLNVGQGQSIILQSEGKTYLVDCGGSYSDTAADAASQKLLSQGITRLDGLILTHFDEDHAGGVPYLLSRISADMIFVPDYSDESGILRTMEEMALGKIRYVGNDLILTFGATKISIFSPAVPDSDNESSLAVLFQRENCDILITGDRSGFGERVLMKQTELPDLEILVAGHHGSRHSTCEELLAATTPEIVVISVGQNSYGHPAEELLERLRLFGCTVYRTDIHGTITFRR